MTAALLVLWILSPHPGSVSPALARVLPEVHAVNVEEREIVVRSAGLSTHYLGPLQSNPDPQPMVQEYVFHLPRYPQASVSRPATPAEYAGVFLNGVPIFNQFQTSYQGRNLWHFDPLGARDGHSAPGLLEQLASQPADHSPIIGFALDGFPVYGPWHDGHRMRSSYRLRAITKRVTWANGTRLIDAQRGPDVSAAYPLGTFAEDYEYVPGSGDLDESNGALVNGAYAYFLSTGPDGRPEYPYLIGGSYYGQPIRAASPAIAARRESVTLRNDTANPKAGVPVHLAFEFAQRTLEFVHERPIHLLIVSEDLAEFEHVHPQLRGDAYVIDYTFMHGGKYRAYADFTPPGSEQRIEAFDFVVDGPKRMRTAASENTLRVTMKADAPLIAGRDVPLRFAIGDREGLQPYLGAWAHFVVVQEGLRSFQHAHPMDPMSGMAHCTMATGAPPTEVSTMVNFPTSGHYKLWAQFQSRGEVIAVPFEMNVLRR